jgi:hypothetical protein
MSNIKMWKCDVCGSEFKNTGDEQQFKYNYSLNIDIDSADIISGRESLRWNDVCENCMRKIVIPFIEKLNEETEKNEK